MTSSVALRSIWHSLLSRSGTSPTPNGCSINSFPRCHQSNFSLRTIFDAPGIRTTFDLVFGLDVDR